MPLLNHFMVKRINFNMADECHALLKSVCALKGVTLSDYVYDLIALEFAELVKNDPQVKQMFMSADYPEGSRAAALKLKTIEEDLSKRD